jgi:hypothetical protein
MKRSLGKHKPINSNHHKSLPMSLYKIKAKSIKSHNISNTINKTDYSKPAHRRVRVVKTTV